MIIRVFIRFALRGLTKRAWRTSFPILTVMVGVMLLTGTRLALDSMPQITKVLHEEAYMADFSIHIKGAPAKVVEELLGSVRNVKDVDLRLFFRSIIHTPGQWPKEADILVFGVRAPEPPLLNRIVITGGRYFEHEAEQGLIMEDDYGHWRLGSVVYLETPFRNASLGVVGACKAIWMPRWYISSTVYALIPLKTLQSLLKLDGVINLVLVKVEDPSRVKETMGEVAEALKPYGVLSQALEGKLIPIAETESYYSYLVMLISLIGFSLLIVGLAIVYTVISLSTSQELREIGMLKTLGATRRCILLTYVFKGSIIGFIGSGLGIALSLILAAFLFSGFIFASLTLEGVISTLEALEKALSRSYMALLNHLALGTSLSALAAIPSAWKASNLAAAQAVRSFPGLPVQAEGSLRPWLSRSPLTLRYALRSLSRRRARELIIVLVIVISVSLNTVLLTAAETQNLLVDRYSDSLRFDFLIVLSKPSSIKDLERPFSKLLQRIENFEVGYYTQAKVLGFTTSILGVAANTSLFSPEMVEGRLTREGYEAVFPEHLARRMGVGVNDRLIFSGQRRNVTLTVVGLRLDPVLNIILVPLAIAQEVDGFEGKVNIVGVKVKDGVDVEVMINDVKRKVPNYLWHLTKEGALKMLREVITDVFNITASTIILSTWLVSIILIFSISGQTITEERRVIATLKALGLTRLRCILLTLSKLMIIGLIAALLSLTLSLAFLKLFSILLAYTMMFTLPMTISPKTIINSIAFIAATSIPSGLILGLSASLTKTSETLRYE